MRRRIQLFLIVLVVASTMFGILAVASPATSYTWTYNAKGRWTKTQDAYLPERTLIELGLSEPEDLFVDDQDRLYIADTGNSRIVRYDIHENEIIDIIEYEGMKTPKGVFVTGDGNIYVADAKASAIHRFDEEGNWMESFERPTDIAFGDTPFNPVRIAVDSKKNMYIIGEGVLNGIIHLSNRGEFLGYFASNKVTLNPLQQLQDVFFTDEQMDNLGSRVPLTMTNVYVDDENIVYSTTMGQEASQHLAKHNTAGKNVFTELEGADDYIDLYVDYKGIIYAASLDGNIGIFSPDGEFIHVFGAFMVEEDISGLFTELGSIAVDSEGTIWAADSSTSYIQSFVPTAYAHLIYDALEAFKQGRYEEAEDLWLSVLQKNQMLRLAHSGIGKVYLYTQRYEEAMVHLKIANSKYYYSQAYWEVRNIWLQAHLATIIIGLIILGVVTSILKRLDRRMGIFKGFRRFKKAIRKHKLMDDFLFMGDFVKHPINAFYDLRIGLKGSYLSATIWIGLFLVAYVHSSFGRGFLYTPVPLEDLDFTAMILGFFAIGGLFILTNYLIASIQDGDGGIGDLYKMVAYAIGPMLFGIVLVTGLSYILSYNEEFLIELIEVVAPIWSLVLLILGLQETHTYTTREAIKSIIISIAFMLIIAIVILIVMLMGEQVMDFFEIIIREVIRNVTR